MATYNLGKFIMTPRGTYSSTATYNRLDFVLYQGSSYVCKSNNTLNVIPTNTTFWQLLAQAGQATMTESQKQEIISGILSQGVIIDPDYNTFTAEEKTKLAALTEPNTGTLTIKRNNTTVGTFNANASTNSTINIAVPTDYIQTAQTTTIDDAAVDIDKLEYNHIYVLTQPQSVKIEGYSNDNPIAPDVFSQSYLPTYIYIYAKDTFTIDVPVSDGNQCTFAIGRLDCETDRVYRVTVRANVWQVEEIIEIAA